MLRFGTLGAANITPRALIYPCVDEPGVTVYAIAARDRVRAAAFASAHHIPQVLDDYQQVVSHPKVDLVYNPLHIPAHMEWTLAALSNGKHVLCEKSLACNAQEAQTMAQAAQDAGLVLMDAFHYRYHPIFARAKEIYDSGELGEIHTIAAAFHIPVTDPDGIRMNYRLGGGVTMDIGCYPISWVRHITGLEPTAVAATAEVGPPNVDVMLRTELDLPGGIKATTSGDMRGDAKFQAYLRVEGTLGYMHLINPLVPQIGHTLRVSIGNNLREESLDRRSTYGYQLDAFLAAVNHGESLPTDAWDGVAQMRVIDQAYTAAGLPLRGLSDVS
ncbi:MAG: Gfo/Idh/MocA family oxidoreductase [Pseudomonadota bacterium]